MLPSVRPSLCQPTVSFETLEDRRLLSGGAIHQPVKPAAARPTPLVVDAPAASLAVGTNVNASKLAGNQSSPLVAVNPTNPQDIVIVSDGDTQGESVIPVMTSRDGGATWSTTFIGSSVDGLPAANPRPDARVAFDAFGNVYVAYMVAASSTDLRIMVTRSSDGGSTFAPAQTAVQIRGGALADYPGLATGVDATAPRKRQAIFLSYTNTATGHICLVSATSSGLGDTSKFSAPTTVSDGAGSYSTLAVGPNGEVVVAWESNGDSVGPNTILIDVDPDGRGAKSFGADHMITASNVGGWDTIPAQPDRSIDARPSLAFDRSGGANNGRLYCTYVDAPAVGSADTDVYLRYTDTLGSAWSAPLRVNDDASGKSQFNPALAVDPKTGNVAVSWMDCRNSAADTAAQSYATVSTDHGRSVLPNVRVSAGASSQSGAHYNGPDLDYGDQSGLAFVNGRLTVTWADNSNSTADNPDGTGSNFDVYVSNVTLL